MVRVVFVCLGNICRSPLGEGVFKELLREKGLEDQFVVDSAGTADYHIGKLPDPGSRRVAVKKGFSIDDQRARQFKSTDLNEWDYVIAMDASNRENIEKLGKVAGELHMMRDFDPEGNGDVPDPYQLDDSAFDNVHTIIRRSCEKLLDHILSKR
ncbi:phosphotyrosine protein phosphatase [Ammoniphilus oxalaticus]|uniref:protein-tyrosine-phosphatase n=1 Tax=Ammoniphilus oxalaticus TaxID=66863 RepID=A0A419SNT1_9BACL|nr:low molecular weight protein-tyrosine-phosphatase [Ammoniphilus oxalaticus]RKD25913.1 phosphotyrosine protein phosphatase [Ammoniphilus oxalaticus]